MTESLGLLARSVAATALVLAALLALQWLARRRLRIPWAARGLPRNGRVLEVVETSFLPEGASLHVVRAGAKRFVVGRTSASVTYLCAVAGDGEHGATQSAS